MRIRSSALVIPVFLVGCAGCGPRTVTPTTVKPAEVIITMLPAGKHVVSVWTEVVPAAANGALVIDCSTVDVESARTAHGLTRLANVDLLGGVLESFGLVRWLHGRSGA